MTETAKLPASSANENPAGSAQQSGGFGTVYELYPGIDQMRQPEYFLDIKDEFFWQTYAKCKAYSLLGIDAFYNLYRSIEYIAVNKIPGDFVECGVFLGGAVLAMSDFAHHFGITDRDFFLYDTFAGFPKDTSETDFHGKEVKLWPHREFRATVESVLAQSLYPPERFRLVPGMVEETLRKKKPGTICLLRLDTDYYESTRVELEELYPRLATGGVLIIDDYGLFQGARRATDEFLAKHPKRMLLTRVNYSVRSGLKQ
jgi:O-methyltransferase